jgi:hypothetical protein
MSVNLLKLALTESTSLPHFVRRSAVSDRQKRTDPKVRLRGSSPDQAISVRRGGEP